MLPFILRYNCGLIKMDRSDVVKHLIISGVKFTDRVGAYSSVFTVNYNGIACAAKEVHDLLLEDASRDELQKLRGDFLQECVQHSKLHHPNIVKMLGVCYPNDQTVMPVLMMELMECNLTQMLENYRNIPMYVKLSILQDVSRAICYLHTLNPPLMHRNLTSNNILLTTSLVAKVSNFAVIKEVSPLPSGRMTKVPGASDFMPPEVFKNDPHYGLPLDVFSFGCVVCHVITQKWPTPLDQFKYNTFPTTERIVLSEIGIQSRYITYIDQISEESLKQLVITCLDDDQERRPSISLVSERITSIITG